MQTAGESQHSQELRTPAVQPASDWFQVALALKHACVNVNKLASELDDTDRLLKKVATNRSARSIPRCITQVTTVKQLLDRRKPEIAQWSESYRILLEHVGTMPVLRSLFIVVFQAGQCAAQDDFKKINSEADAVDHGWAEVAGAIEAAGHPDLAANLAKQKRDFGHQRKTLAADVHVLYTRADLNHGEVPGHVDQFVRLSLVRTRSLSLTSSRSSVCSSLALLLLRRRSSDRMYPMGRLILLPMPRTRYRTKAQLERPKRQLVPKLPQYAPAQRLATDPWCRSYASCWKRWNSRASTCASCGARRRSRHSEPSFLYGRQYQTMQ
jgi:hypothetical protein